MATEKDFELIDNYLSNQLEGQEKLDFEKRLESDSSLKSEFEFQKELIEGIRKARIADLKTMLNQAVIPSPSNLSLLAKAGLAVAIVAAVGTGLYFWLDKDESAVQAPIDTTAETITATPTPEGLKEEESVSEETATPQKSEPVQTETITKPDLSDRSIKETESKQSPVKQPNLEPYDPTKELEHSSEKPEAVDEASTPSISTSSIVVETDNTNKKLNFHYQFKDGKLFLLGSFEKDLYEILEFFNNNERTIFLYYSSNYYLLDEKQTEPTPLKAIIDQALLQKLKEYRGK